MSMCYIWNNTMNIIQCPHCKVRYRANSLVCPICNKAVDGATINQEANGTLSLPVDTHVKRFLLVIMFMILFIPCIVVLASNYMYARAFTWSPLVVVVVVFSYMYFCCLLMLYKHKVLLCISLIVITITFLFVFDTIMHFHWFLSIAFPITILWVVLGYISFMQMKKLSTHAFSIIGIVLFLIAIALLGTDVIINYAVNKTLLIGWSAISTGCIVPFAAVMFYLQKHKETIERWLHF